MYKILLIILHRKALFCQKLQSFFHRKFFTPHPAPTQPCTYNPSPPSTYIHPPPSIYTLTPPSTYIHPPPSTYNPSPPSTYIHPPPSTYNPSPPTPTSKHPQLPAATDVPLFGTIVSFYPHFCYQRPKIWDVSSTPHPLKADWRGNVDENDRRDNVDENDRRDNVDKKDW